MAASKGYTLPELVATSVKDLCDEERKWKAMCIAVVVTPEGP